MTIDRDGRVELAAVEWSDAVSGLQRAALEAARQFVFQPALQHGRPVRSEVMIPFRFMLEEAS